MLTVKQLKKIATLMTLGAAIPILAADKTAPGLIDPPSLPQFAQGILNSHGDRMTKPQKERLVVQGVVNDAKGSRNVRIVWEVPGRFRYDEDGGKSLTADTHASKSTATTDTDRGIIESLFADSVDGFFEWLQNRVPLRRIGLGYRFVDVKNRNVISLLDVYELLVPVDGTGGKIIRPKQFFFDSRSQYLSRVHYVLSAAEGSKSIQTVYSDWVKSNEVPLPARIERWENGSSSFSIAIKSGAVGASANDGTFTQP